MRKITLLVLCISGGFWSLGQETFSKLSLTKVLSVKIDTTYFDDGQIETITRQSPIESTLGVTHDLREIKIVYQYDRCGHWRNTTTVFENNNRSSYGIFGPFRWQEDKVAIDASCDVPWTKPFIF